MKKGFTLLEITIAIAVGMIVIAIAIPGISRARMVSRENAAQAALTQIGNALETFYTVNDQYPLQEDQLLQTVPPYLSKSHCAQTLNGYQYDCAFTTDNYTVTARPTNCQTTGARSFTLFTNQNVTTDAECNDAVGMVSQSPLGP